MTITEKAAYLKGLAEGMNLGESDNEKLFKAIIDTIDEIALSIDDLDAEHEELAERVDEIDEDLAAVEDEVYGDCCCDDGCDDDCCCGDDDFYEVTCPACNETICVDLDSLDSDSIVCPNCGTELEFDFEDDDDSQDASDKE